jgi:hypothetical protein
MAQNIIQINRPVTSTQNTTCLNIITDIISLIKAKHS